jgi:excisionase family DNA binding protein
VTIERHYKTSEVAELLSVHKETVLRLAQRGEIRSVRVGHDRRFPESAIGEFLDRNSEGARPVVASIETWSETSSSRARRNA